MIDEQQLIAAKQALSSMPWWTTQAAGLDRYFHDTQGIYDEQIITIRMAALESLYPIGVSHRTPARLREHIRMITAETGKADQEIRLHDIQETDLENLNDQQIHILADICSAFARSSRSFGELRAASKYLHFCYPGLFPIWDRHVLRILEDLLQERIDTYRSLLCRYKDYLNNAKSLWMRNSTAEFNTPVTLTPVRTFDAVLWLIGQIRQKERMAHRQAYSAITEEIDIYLENNPEARPMLAGMYLEKQSEDGPRL